VGDLRVEVLWTERAARDLGRAIGFAEERGQRAADRVARQVLERVDLLASQPELGSPVELDAEPTLYRRLVAGPYSVYYRVARGVEVTEVIVVRVWHSSRDPATLVLE